jgi:hypothetical protein
MLIAMLCSFKAKVGLKKLFKASQDKAETRFLDMDLKRATDMWY